MEEPTTAGAGQRLRDRHVVITGAASGIGRAIAELFHREGAKLALIDRDSGVSAVAAPLQAVSLPFDLGNAESIASTIDRAAQEMGGLDGVVNCAAMGVATPIAATDFALLSKFIAINLTAPYLLCRAALPHLQKAPVATIVNIASGQALLPNAPNNTAYAATKGGLVAFTKSLAAEVAPKVRANAVCPGVTNTPMAAPLFAGYAKPSDAPWVKQYALQRIAEPIEIACAALFLTSTESSFITGVALAVDGGRTFH